MKLDIRGRENYCEDNKKNNEQDNEDGDCPATRYPTHYEV